MNDSLIAEIVCPACCNLARLGFLLRRVPGVTKDGQIFFGMSPPPWSGQNFVAEGGAICPHCKEPLSASITVANGCVCGFLLDCGSQIATD